jgi:hypothetical protein
MSEVMRFWSRRGVDGFGVDAIDQVIKDVDFADNPPNPDRHEGRPSTERFLRVRQTDRPRTVRGRTGASTTTSSSSPARERAPARGRPQPLLRAAPGPAARADGAVDARGPTGEAHVLGPNEGRITVG